jgi:dipeptidyl aminopeptidase/acylaminoacyl peptidase
VNPNRRLSWYFLVAALAFATVPAPAAAPGFTLDEVLSAPFVDGLVAAPTGSALAWSVHERGARNVAVWKDGSAREITHDAADDGEELSGISFVAGGDAVVYERGGSGQDGGDGNPNPTAPAKREPRKILLTSVASGATIQLGTGQEPAVSPKGDRVAWIGDDGQVTSATIASADGGKTWTAGKADTLFTVRGSASGPLWSPDGSRLAITNQRGDHSYIAMYTLGATNVTFAAPAFSHDGNPVWSPDGTRIAFLRLPGDVSTLSYYDDPSRYPPWSIGVADAATGSGGIVWRAPRGRGYEFNIADGVQPLWWSRDGRIAFVWERDGWRHLYAIAATGGTPRLLTPGAYDVEAIAAAADGNALLYTSNEGDLDSRHVWSVPFAGGERKRITGGSTNQWSPVALADGRVAYVDASYAVPGTVTLAGAGAAVPLLANPLPPDYPANALVRPAPIVFAAPDGLKIHGQLFLAHDGRRKHPALIFVHGGPERQMLTTYHYFEAYSNLYELNQYLVSRGFDVLSVNYRSGIMYGHDFYEPPGRGQLGASEYQDVVAGARVLAARPDVDRKRIGIYGLSYGGYLTALALARNSDIFAAGADQAGVHDWRGWIDSFGAHPVGTPQQRAVAFAASPMGDLSHWRSPVLLDAGDDDRNVPFSQTVSLAALLEARGVDVTLHAVPDELHEYTVYAHELDRFARTAAFLEARLGTK